MEWALYGEPDGFYASGRGAGRRTGDFLTSVEVGPLFGRLVARLADRCWEELGRPSDFTLLDAGAGRGTLARSVLAARAACGDAGALRYVLVERSAALRREHEQLLHDPPAGARVESRADLPAGPITGLVVANELLDNLPCRVLERTADGWAEVYVKFESGGGPPAPVASSPSGRSDGGVIGHVASGPGRLAETLRRVPVDVEAVVAALAPGAPVGGRIPLASAAVDWVGRALTKLERGTLVVLDYTDTSASLASRPPREWMRTYRAGVRGHDPLVDPGALDITVEVPLDQILATHPGAVVCDQASFLRTLGIEDLVAEGRATWHERAAVGDLPAIEARSRIHEAESLLDPAGLGAFTVITWRC